MSEVAYTVLCSDNSDNCLGRALLLADLVRKHGSVQVVGPRLSDKVWAAASGWDIPVVSTPLYTSGQYPSVTRWLRPLIKGTRLIVSKARVTSLGLALACGVRPSRMVLDVDDWDPGFFDFRWRPGSLARTALQVFSPRELNGFLPTLALSTAAKKFPRLTVSNSVLQRRIGGVVLPHVRDTDVLNPDRGMPEIQRATLGLEGRPWVGFIGTLRRHKGVGDLVEALAASRATPRPGLVLAGVNEREPYAQELIADAVGRLGADRLRVFPEFPFDELPKWVSLADVICLPSQVGDAAQGQLPAKLFDAMCMGKPVIASDINDLRAVLGDGGLVVPPSSPARLSTAIDELLSDPALMRRLGYAGRRRAIEQFSYVAGARTLTRALEGLQACI